MKGGREVLPKSHDHAEVSMHRDYCYEGGKRGREVLPKSHDHAEVSMHRDYCYEGAKGGGRGDLKAMIMLKLACTGTTVMKGLREEGG